MRTTKIISLIVALATLLYVGVLAHYAAAAVLPTNLVVACVLAAFVVRLSLIDIIAAASFFGMWQGLGIPWYWALLTVIPAYLINLPETFSSSALSIVPSHASQGPLDPAIRPDNADLTIAIRGVQFAALALGCFILGWLARPQLTLAGVESVASEAEEARETMVFRDKISDRTGPEKNEIPIVARRAGIPVPQLPRGWQVQRADVGWSKFGPSVEVSAVTQGGVRVVLFATHEATRESRPVLSRGDDEIIVYWNRRDTGYALVADASPALVVALASQVRAGEINTPRLPAA